MAMGKSAPAKRLRTKSVKTPKQWDNCEKGSPLQFFVCIEPGVFTCCCYHANAAEATVRATEGTTNLLVHMERHHGFTRVKKGLQQIVEVKGIKPID